MSGGRTSEISRRRRSAGKSTPSARVRGVHAGTRAPGQTSGRLLSILTVPLARIFRVMMKIPGFTDFPSQKIGLPRGPFDPISDRPVAEVTRRENPSTDPLRRRPELYQVGRRLAHDTGRRAIRGLKASPQDPATSSA